MSPTTRPRDMRALLLASIGATLGCTDAAPQESPGATGSVATASASAVTSAALATFDQADYCARVCKRASDCGLEKAAGLAVDGRVDEQAALAQATSGQPAVEKSCAQACTKVPVTGESLGAARSAEACLAVSNCGAFRACLMAVAPE